MSTINGSGTGQHAATVTVMTHDVWLASQAKLDEQYDAWLPATKQMETLSKAEVIHSSNPVAAMTKLKLSDNERSALAEVAKLNSWSRQATEATYKLFVAGSGGESSSIGGFLQALTATPEGYYGDDGDTMLGLTEAHRRSILNLPEETQGAETGDIETPDDASVKKEAQENLSAAVSAMSKKITDEDKAALSDAAKLNGVDEQSAVAYYKIYLAQNGQPSMSDFLQLLTQNEPNSYGKDGGLKQNDGDDNHVIRVTV